MPTVHLMTDLAQSLYLDAETRRLRPSLTFVKPNGSISFEINDIGLKGDALDPQRKLAVVWGDSCIFGVDAGWPCLLDAMVPGYQFLNGGIEGDPFENIVERALELNQEHTVHLNIISAGWHSKTWRIIELLTNVLQNVQNPVLLTNPTALNRQLLNQDLSKWFSPGFADTGFYFGWGTVYSIEAQVEVYERALRMNSDIRMVGERMGCPVIDLFRIFDTEDAPDFRENFFDMVHPRPKAYPKIARVVYEGIKPLLGLE